jgi:hypothetical protein
VSLETEFDVTGTIARLFIYPVKSCAGIEVQEAVLTETGLDWTAPGWWWMRRAFSDPAHLAAHGLDPPTAQIL